MRPQLEFWYGLEGESVRVTIALSYWEPGVTRVQTSAAELKIKVSHLLQPDQKIEVDDFVEYGMKPFAIKIVRINHADRLPSFSSCTDAIQLISVERVEGESPSFRFTVRNVGSRRINSLSGKSDPRGAWTIGSYRPVAEPGQQFTIEMRVRDGLHLDALASLEVTCAVFDDGDFAGDRDRALFLLQYQTCYRLTMELLLELFNEQIESGATDLGELRSKVTAVCQNVGVDEITAASLKMTKLIPRFPEFAQNRSCAGYTDRIAKVSLGRIDEFVRDHPHSITKGQAIDFLKSLRALYLSALFRWKPRSSG